MQDEQTMIEENSQQTTLACEQPTTEPAKALPDEKQVSTPVEQEDEASDELTVLRARVEELEAQLAEREYLSARIGRECDEFVSYFPEVSLHAVPDEVWGQVKSGVPLSAAYALYEKKQQKQQEEIERIGARGAAMTAGGMGAAGDEYFSPSQVRAMSPVQVRENYDRIFESMRHWQ